jgi:hypothetical protein
MLVKDALWTPGDHGIAPPPCAALGDAAATPDLCDMPDWFRLVAKHLVPPVTPIRLTEDGTNHGAMLCLARAGPRRMMGLTNWYSPCFRPVFFGDCAMDARIAAISHFGLYLTSMTHNIDFTLIPEGDGSRHILEAGLRQAGWRVTATPHKGHWFSHFDTPDFDRFWAARPGALRHTHDRKSAKYPLDCIVYAAFSDDLWAEYAAVYAASWKPAEGDPAFLRDVARYASDIGAFRLGIARHDGVAMATQFWTVHQGKAQIHKLAHRQSAAAFSAGTQLSASMFRHVLDEDRATFISFGPGDERYKQDWMDQREQLWALTCWHPRSLYGRAGHMAQLARTRLAALRQRIGR